MRFTIFGVQFRLTYIGDNVPKSRKPLPQFGKIYFKDEVIGNHVCILGWSIQVTRRPEGFPIKGQTA